MSTERFDIYSEIIGLKGVVRGLGKATTILTKDGSVDSIGDRLTEARKRLEEIQSTNCFYGKVEDFESFVESNPTKRFLACHELSMTKDYMGYIKGLEMVYSNKIDNVDGVTDLFNNVQSTLDMMNITWEDNYSSDKYPYEG